MPLVVQVSDLESRVRQRADIENSDFITDAEVTAFVFQSATKLYGEIVAANELYYYQQRVFQIDTGEDTIQFELDNTTLGETVYWNGFYKILGVDLVFGAPTEDRSGWLTAPTGPKYTLRRFAFTERNMYHGEQSSWQAALPRYLPRGSDKILFIPKSDGTNSIIVHYVPPLKWPQAEPDEEGDPVDIFDGINGWEEFIILDAAIKCLIKDQAIDPSPLIAERDRELQRIRTDVSTRDQGEPHYVVDTDNLHVDEERLWAIRR